MVAFTLYILVAAGEGLLVALGGALFERYLINIGVVRGNTKWLVGDTIFLFLLERLINFNAPLNWNILFLIVVVPIIVNRTDIFFTVGRGRWWWERDGEE